MTANFSEQLVEQLAALRGHVPIGIEILACYGQPFTTVAACPPEQRGPLGDCFANASRLALLNDLAYCEGYAVRGNLSLPLHHAWCVNDRGTVIDPTWDDGGHYFGTVFSDVGLAEILDLTGLYGVYCSLDSLRHLGVDGVRTLLVQSLVPRR